MTTSNAPSELTLSPKTDTLDQQSAEWSAWRDRPDTPLADFLQETLGMAKRLFIQLKRRPTTLIAGHYPSPDVAHPLSEPSFKMRLKVSSGMTSPTDNSWEPASLSSPHSAEP